MGKRVASLRTLVLGVVFVAGLMSAGMALALEIGERAPDFTLPSTTGEKISLSQFRGKKHVLIQFYRTDFNPV
jgi:peroxiredoxin